MRPPGGSSGCNLYARRCGKVLWSGLLSDSVSHETVEIFRKKPKNKALPFPISLKLKNGIIKGDLQTSDHLFLRYRPIVNRIKKTLLKTNQSIFHRFRLFLLPFLLFFLLLLFWFHFSVYFITHFHFGN